MKKIAMVALIACLLLAMATPALADIAYGFQFKPPYAGCLRSSLNAHVVEGGTPWVRQSQPAAYPVKYVLTVNYHAGPAATTTATMVEGNTGTLDMPYLSGYGGSGQAYHLSAYPGVTNFTTFIVQGSWEP